MANRILSKDEIAASLAWLDPENQYWIGDCDISWTGDCGIRGPKKLIARYGTADLMMSMATFSERILQPLVRAVKASTILRNDTGIHDMMLGQRGATHGDFRAMSTRIQQIKAIMRMGSKWTDMLEPQKEALELIATKIGRIIEGDPEFKDHWDDLGGYAAKASEFCRKETTSA